MTPSVEQAPGVDHATEARLTVGLSIALGDEVQRHAREVDGEVVVAPETFRTARQRIAAVAQALTHG